MAKANMCNDGPWLLQSLPGIKRQPWTFGVQVLFRGPRTPGMIGDLLGPQGGLREVLKRLDYGSLI